VYNVQIYEILEPIYITNFVIFILQGSRSVQTKDYNIGMCCFSVKHAALRKKSKDRLVQNQDNVINLAQ